MMCLDGLLLLLSIMVLLFEKDNQMYMIMIGVLGKIPKD
jgi:hypothetical protein